jgi:signal transduction histidine kinase
VSAAPEARRANVRSFRTKLLIAMALVVVALTTLGLFMAQRKVAIEAEHDLLQDFRNELATLHGVREVRHAALAERTRDLVQRARIHAALEDNALDLLYPSAKDELRDILAAPNEADPPGGALHAKYYRFLDNNGAVITPPPGAGVGELRPEEEAQLALPRLSDTQQIGYLVRRAEGNAEVVDEVIAVPIVSMATGEVISALVLGFKPEELGRNRSGSEIRSGIWLRDRLHLPFLSAAEQKSLGERVGGFIATRQPETSFEVDVGGRPHLLFYKQLNPEALYPPAFEIALYPLANAHARLRELRTHVLLAGAALLLIGLVASHLIARRLSEPVEQLAVTSEENRAHWEQAESKLEETSEELKRAARFSADASHQLKTPVTVLRAGIEELLLRDDFEPEVYDELSALLHQTYRITGIVDDLLLLSRMDAGRLQIQFTAVDLCQLLDEWLDDFSALPDEFDVQVQIDCPANLHVAGERRYVSLIVQNLLENARKYNRTGGRIRAAAREEEKFVILTIGNTGRTIVGAAREHIFERFHRGEMGENVPGHGLGLNLARELARLHGGDVRLVQSENDWTEFEVRFRVANAPAPAASPARRA